VATMTADQVAINSTGDRIACSVVHPRVLLEVLLPAGFPQERRHGVERYACAAVAAMADKIGRDE
jgi:hypothetical protein